MEFNTNVSSGHMTKMLLKKLKLLICSSSFKYVGSGFLNGNKDKQRNPETNQYKKDTAASNWWKIGKIKYFNYFRKHDKIQKNNN